MADMSILPNELGITLDVGTVMGVGVEYTAGEGIWIEDHVINADVTQEEVDGKAAVGHKHVIADVDGLQAALDAKGVRLVTRVTDGNLEISIA